MLSSKAKIENITYKQPRLGVYSGYTTDGKVYYLKKKLIEGGEVTHSTVLVLIYPQAYQNEVENLIDVVKDW
jgi:hypothetical protein